MKAETTTTYGAGDDALTATLYRTGHDLNGSLLAIAADGTRLRARVRRNFYDDQSYGVAEAWTPSSGFQNVISWPIEKCRVAAFSSTTRDEQGWREAISLDLLQLLTTAEAFLSS